MIRKIFLVTLIISILIMCSGLLVSANKSSEFLKNQSEAISNYSKIRKSLVDYPENYAGAYIDNEGMLNVKVTGSDDLNIRNITDNAKIKYQLNVKYSMEFLESIKKRISENMIKLGVTGVGVSDKDNKVFVYYNDDANLDSIMAYIDDIQAVELIKQDSKLTYTTDVVNGTQTII